MKTLNTELPREYSVRCHTPFVRELSKFCPHDSTGKPMPGSFLHSALYIFSSADFNLYSLIIINFDHGYNGFAK